MGSPPPAWGVHLGKQLTGCLGQHMLIPGREPGVHCFITSAQHCNGVQAVPAWRRGHKEGSNSHAEEGDEGGEADSNNRNRQPVPLGSLCNLQGQKGLSARCCSCWQADFMFELHIEKQLWHVNLL